MTRLKRKNKKLRAKIEAANAKIAGLESELEKTEKELEQCELSNSLATDILCMALGPGHGRGTVVEHAQKAADVLAEKKRPAKEDSLQRLSNFNATVGADGANKHPDRCKCQVDDPIKHIHYMNDSMSDRGPYACDRCLCEEYSPAVDAHTCTRSQTFDSSPSTPQFTKPIYMEDLYGSPVTFITERTKPLDQVTAADVPRGLSPEDVATPAVVTVDQEKLLKSLDDFWKEQDFKRLVHFNSTTGPLGFSTKNGIKGANEHPDRCKCQLDDPTPHVHYEDEYPHSCARCLDCESYTPAALMGVYNEHAQTHAYKHTYEGLELAKEISSARLSHLREVLDKRKKGCVKCHNGLSFYMNPSTGKPYECPDCKDK